MMIASPHRKTRALLLCLTAIALVMLPADLARSADLSLTVKSPDGGETLTANGLAQTISWKTGAKSSHKFHYFLIPQKDTPILPPPPLGGSSVAFIEDFGGYSVGGIAPLAPATSYTGVMLLDTDTPTGDYKLRIYASTGESLMEPEDASFFGESEMPFTVKSLRPNTPSIQIVAPDDGEEWAFGIPQLIRFESKGVSGMQLALQNLSTGQPCTIATNVTTKLSAWMYIPVLSARCIGSSAQTLVAGEYKAALYDNNWETTRVSSYSSEPFTIKNVTWESDMERLTALVKALTDVLTVLRAGR